MTTTIRQPGRIGRRQHEILRIFDFYDSLGEDIRILNVCRRKTKWNAPHQEHCACGFSFPDNLWTPERQASGKHRWKFRCRVVWDEFVKLGTGEDPDPQIKGWVDDLIQKHGENIQK